MHKRAALFNDLSGLGRCSLVADIAVLSAMGIEPCPVPTAVLSAQTGYPGYWSKPLTQYIKNYTAHWQELNIQISGILSGFLTDTNAIGEVEDFLEHFKHDDTVYLCDPVLGDDGKGYPGFGGNIIERTRTLSLKADILTPNITEYCILTGAPYDELQKSPADEAAADKQAAASSRMSADESKKGLSPDDLFEKIARYSSIYKDKDLIITGIHTFGSGDLANPHRTKSVKDSEGVHQEAGAPMITNLLVHNGHWKAFSSPLRKGSYSGTGDLFAAAVLGGVMRGETIENSIQKAQDFLDKSVADAERDHVPHNDGVSFERYLSMLNPAPTR